MKAYITRLKKLLSPEKEHPNIRFVGNYTSWAQARKDSAGYDSGIIFQKTSSAVMKMKRGEAVYERDSVLFDRAQYSWPLLSGLLWIASRNDNRLNLLDFGGALGTSYFQNRAFLGRLKELHWSIVEQKHYVKFGKANLEDSNLHFYYDIDDCIRKRNPCTTLLSSVLMYLEDPYALLNKAKDIGFDYVLIDKTLFIKKAHDLLTVQRVPSQIYDASYPCWFLGLDKFMNTLTDKYELVADWEDFNHTDVESSVFKGFIFKSRNI